MKTAIQYQTKVSDTEIIQRIKQGDDSVWNIVYKKYYKMMEYFVIKNSGNTDNAYDNFQNTMIALFENVSKENFNLTCSLQTYIYQINRNMWLAELKSQKRHPIDIWEDEVIIADTNTKEEEIEKEYRIKKVEAALQELGEKCRQILDLYYYRKNSMKEIAVLLDYTNDNNAKVQKLKCIKQLKKRVYE